MDIKNLTYEEAYSKLEEIIEELSDDDIKLDQSLKLFKEGNELFNHCNKILEEAENTIVKLVKENDSEDMVEIDFFKEDHGIR